MINLLFYIWVSYHVNACSLPDNLEITTTTYREYSTNRIITDYETKYKGIEYRFYLIDDKLTDCKIRTEVKDNYSKGWKGDPKCGSLKITYRLMQKGQEFSKPKRPDYCSVPVKNIFHN